MVNSMNKMHKTQTTLNYKGAEERERERMERNEAVDGLLSLFSKANRDLSAVHNKLQKEFLQLYPDHANPIKLMERLKKIEEEMSSLKDQCGELLAAKQDLIDKARILLVGNRIQLQRLQASTGVPVTTDDDPAYVSFNQVIDEWGMQVNSRKEDEEEPDSSGINQMLFSAMVQSN